MSGLFIGYLFLDCPQAVKGIIAVAGFVAPDFFRRNLNRARFSGRDTKAQANSCEKLVVLKAARRILLHAVTFDAIAVQRIFARVDQESG